MRLSVVLPSLVLAACTASVPVGNTPISQRVADACDDLASLCSASGTCLPQQTFCGAYAPQFQALFFAEDTCKTTCSGATPCLRACKLDRITSMTNILASVSVTGSVVGDGATACMTLQNSCSTTSQGCSGGEFYCPSFALSTSPCAGALAQCKAACAPHDRTCLRACRDAYRACLSGSTTPDAGTPMPDAPTTTPDAPTTTPDAPAAKPDAPTTTTTPYTYTTDISPVMTGLCNGCHSGSAPPGNYLTDSYSNLFGNGSDSTPNIIIGDSTSLFLQKIVGNHHNVLTLYPGFDKVASTWVVSDNAAK